MAPTLRRPYVKKYSLSLFAVTIGLVLFIIATFYVRPDFFKPVHLLLMPHKRNMPPVVLLWTPYFSESGKWLPSPSNLKCPVSDCIVTDNRNYVPVSSATIFHWRDVDLTDLPAYRGPDQRWVLFNMESPFHTPKNILEFFSGKINWTVSYRKDSDIYAPYGRVARNEAPVPIPTPVANRSLACWLVSNCQTSSRREKYVEMLREFVPVDIYGKCGDHQCPLKGSLECYRDLSKRYKFYLSFENSICKDYATEKLFNALSTDMVPVVMGGEDYREVLPPNSYIDALSFKGPRQLAEYLRDLDKDTEKYLSYLEWKRDYEVIDGGYKWVCDLCRKLHSDDITIHGNLLNWWFQEGKCVSA